MQSSIAIALGLAINLKYNYQRYELQGWHYTRLRTQHLLPHSEEWIEITW